MELGSVHAKVDKYKEILSNTKSYRQDWHDQLKNKISTTLEKMIKETDLQAKVEVQDEIENLEVIMLSLGSDDSGIAEKIPNSNSKRPFIKSNGSLIFQQLFNGKVMIMIAYPFIEGYGQPKPPRMVEIVRPHELTEGYMIRYFSEFLQDVIEWEDYDDDVPEKMGMSNPIGFKSQNIITEEN